MIEYGNPQLANGEAGYYLTTLEAAVQFIATLTPQTLKAPVGWVNRACPIQGSSSYSYYIASVPGLPSYAHARLNCTCMEDAFLPRYAYV